MSAEKPTPYGFEKAAEEAAKMQGLVGNTGSKEDYDAAAALLDAERDAPSRSREADPTETEDRLINYRLSEDDFKIVKEFAAEERERYVDDLEAARVELTPRQKKMIPMANVAIADIFRTHGVELPAKARTETDIVPMGFTDYKRFSAQEEAKTVKEITASGVYDPVLDKAMFLYRVDRWKNDARNPDMLRIVSHELLHAKSYRALQAHALEDENDRKMMVSGYRGGIRIHRLGFAGNSYFCALDEAITETLAMEAGEQVLNGHKDGFRNEFVSKIKDDLDVAMELKGKRTPTTPTPVVDMISRWGRWHALARRFGTFEKRRADFIKDTLTDRTYRYEYSRGSYTLERRMFRWLIHALAAKHGGTKEKGEEIRSMFYQAYLTGNMLPIGRMVEQTLGKGSFRMIAEASFSKKGLEGEELEKHMRRREELWKLLGAIKR